MLPSPAVVCTQEHRAINAGEQGVSGRGVALLLASRATKIARDHPQQDADTGKQMPFHLWRSDVGQRAREC